MEILLWKTFSWIPLHTLENRVSTDCMNTSYGGLRMWHSWTFKISRLWFKITYWKPQNNELHITITKLCTFIDYLISFSLRTEELESYNWPTILCSARENPTSECLRSHNISFSRGSCEFFRGFEADKPGQFSKLGIV